MIRRSPMKRGKRINPKRNTPRRTRPELFFGHKRERLHGEARSARRAEIFERAGGRCEEWLATEWLDINGSTDLYGIRCNRRATEWSHARDGSNKCDCLDPRCSWASCRECHVRRHNCNGKPIAVRKRDIKMEVA